MIIQNFKYRDGPILENGINLSDIEKVCSSVKWVWKDCVYEAWKARWPMWHCPEDDGLSCHQNTLASPWDWVLRVRRCLGYSSCGDDGLPLTEATYGREQCSGLTALEFSPSCQARQRQGLEAGCHVTSSVEQSRWMPYPLSSSSPGRSSAQRGDLPASTDLMKEITILHRRAQRFSWVIPETVKVTLLTVRFGSWK